MRYINPRYTYLLTYLLTSNLYHHDTSTFRHFAPFNESMTLNVPQRSSEVIDFGTNRKRVYIFILVVNSNLDHILHRFRDTAA